MAIATGTITRNLRGAFGDFLFRNYNGKTVVSPLPVYKNETNTPARKQARGNFREATYFARTAMRNAKLQAYYAQKAKQLKLPNAYTAAITDYLRKAKVTAFTRSSFSPKKGAVININIDKKAFKVNNIKVLLCKENGDSLPVQNLQAVNVQKGLFKYTLHDDLPDCALLKITTDEPRDNTLYSIKTSEFRVV